MSIIYHNVAQGLKIPIPEDGEVFRSGSTVFKRVGNEIYEFDTRLGKNFTTDFNSLPSYIIGDVDQALKNITGRVIPHNDSKQLDGSFFTPVPVKATNEVFTQTVRPDNKNSAVITSNLKGVVQKGVSIAEANSAPGTTMSVASTDPNRVINETTGQTAAQMNKYRESIAKGMSTLKPGTSMQSTTTSGEHTKVLKDLGFTQNSKGTWVYVAPKTTTPAQPASGLTYSNPAQNLNIKLPQSGEVFKSGSSVFKRVGNQLFDYDTRLGKGFTADTNTLPDYNIGDVTQAMGNITGGKVVVDSSKQFDGAFFAPTPITPKNETFTQTVRPDNPQSGVITSNVSGVVQPGVSVDEANSAPGTTLSTASTDPNRIINNTTGQTAAQMPPAPTPQSIQDGIQNLGAQGTATDPTLLAFNQQVANMPPPSTNPNPVINTDSFQGTSPVPIAPQVANTTGADATAAGGGATAKSIQDYINMLTPPAGETSTRVKDLIASINTSMETLNGRGAAQLSAEEQQGVNAKKQLLQNAQTSLAQRLAEYKAIQAKYQTLNADVEGKPVTMSSVIGSQAQVNRAMQAELNTKASEIAMIQAEVSGAQGNLDLATDAANRAVDLKFNDAKDAIDIRLKQLELLQGQLDKEEGIRADAIKLYLQDQKDKLSVTTANEKDKNTTLLNQMQKYPDAGITLQDTIESANRKITQNSQVYKKEIVPSGSTGVETTSGSLVYSAQAAAEDSQALEASRGTDGWVDPSVYLRLYQGWIDNGGILGDFLTKYPPKNYVNPANTWLPSFLKNTTTKNDEFDFDSL